MPGLIVFTGRRDEATWHRLCVGPSASLRLGYHELVVTDLHNTAMPLIRYQFGDLGRLSNAACPCRKPYPVLERIVGRAYDTLVGLSGRKYHPESVLYVFEDLRNEGVSLPPFQALQNTDGQLDIRFQTSTAALEEIARRPTPRFHDAFHDDLQPSFSLVSKLEREPSGKLRVVKRTSEAAPCHS